MVFTSTAGSGTEKCGGVRYQWGNTWSSPVQLGQVQRNVEGLDINGATHGLHQYSWVRYREMWRG